MQNPLKRIKGIKEEQHKAITEDDIDLIHHHLMKQYGWISLDEFRNLPLPTLWNLHKRINEDKTMKGCPMMGGRK